MESDKKMLKCEFCNYSTVEKSNLTRHTRTHSSIKQFSCLHCSHRTNDQSNLKVHMRRKHTTSKNTQVQTYDNADTNMQIKDLISDNSTLQEKKDSGCRYFMKTLQNQNQDNKDVGDLTGFGYERNGYNKDKFEGLLAEWKQQKPAVNLQTSHFRKTNTGGNGISSAELEMQDSPHSQYGQQGISVSNLQTSASGRTATNNWITNITEVPCMSGVLPESQREFFPAIPVAYSHSRGLSSNLTEDFHGIEEDNRYRHLKNGTDLTIAPASASAFQQDSSFSQHSASSQRRIFKQPPHKQFQPDNHQQQCETRQSVLTNHPNSQQKEDRNLMSRFFSGWKSYSAGN